MKNKTQEIIKNIKSFNGITLIAVVITTIVLLILTGVSISMLTGSNGIVTQANLAKKMTEISSEEEAIQLKVTLASMQNKLDSSNKYYVGESLYDKTLENGDRWNIIVDNETLKQYGTGYSHISKGTEIENYGKTKYEWIVNYNTGEVIELKSDYTSLSYKSSLVVTKNLLLNIDAANVNDNIESLGSNTTLYYFDDNVYDTKEKRMSAYKEEARYEDVTKFSGYDRQISNDLNKYIDTEKKSFKFYGNNYIELYSNNGFDFSNGCTFEIYGKLTGGTNTTVDDTFTGFWGLWEGKYNKQASTRFGYLESAQKLHYSLTQWRGGYIGSWCEGGETGGAPWNQQYEINDFWNKENYFTFVFELLDDNTVTQKIYRDGELLAQGDLSNEYYSNFVNEAKNSRYIELGRCSMSNESNWCYTKGDIYCSRLYNKALSSDEVKANVTKTKIYRQIQ